MIKNVVSTLLLLGLILLVVTFTSITGARNAALRDKANKPRPEPASSRDETSAHAVAVSGITLPSLVATTYTVTNTGDSLSTAIAAANSNPGADTIVFNIPTSDPGYNSTTGVWKITLGPSGLPKITDPLTIDATTQPGSQGMPRLELNGRNVSNDRVALIWITAGNSVVRGLAITSMRGHGIKLETGGGNVIESNFIGTDTLNSADVGNRDHGIDIENSSNNRIGGSSVATRNLIAGNGWGVFISGASIANKIQGNDIGQDNIGHGFGNGPGVLVLESNNNIIGLAADGTGAGNRVKGNGGGVIIYSGTGNRISGNSIFSNFGDIVLGDGDTPNDPGDSDEGPNNLQNFPVITSANSSNLSTTIGGALNSTPNTIFIIEFYSNQFCNSPSINNGGQIFLGSKTITTDGSGNASFSGANSATFPVNTRNQFITAIAIDPAGNTSEFSECLMVTNAAPSPTPTPSCNYSFNSDSVSSSVPAGGGSGFTINVSAAPGCGWTAVSDDSWITINSGSGGSGTVKYSVSPNPGENREGGISIAGRFIIVYQMSGCAYSISSASRTFTENGGTGVVNVTPSNAACGWYTVTENSDPFVTIQTPSQGFGNGTVSFSVAPNLTGIGRVQEIEIANHNSTENQIFTVYQPVGDCFYGLSPSYLSVPADGATISDGIQLKVIAPAGCAWTASENEDWIYFGHSISGTGNGFVNYFVKRNEGKYRSGAIYVAGQRHIVNQTEENNCPLAYLQCIAVPQSCTQPPTSYKAPGAVNQLYDFRDHVLAKTPRGKKYIHDYYQYAGEITKLLIFNPQLLSRSVVALQRYQPVVESVLNRERTSANLKQSQSQAMTASLTDLEPTLVTDSELDDVDELLKSLSEEASGGLRQMLEALGRDIRDPQVQSEFGVQIREGELRALPETSHNLLGMIDRLSPFDLGSRLQSLNPFGAKDPIAEPVRNDQSPRRTSAEISEAYGQLPISFEANHGQVASRVNYLSLGAGYSLFLTPTEAVLALPLKENSEKQQNQFELPDLIRSLKKTNTQRVTTSFQTLRMNLDGGNPVSRVKGHDVLPGKSNYFIGDDSRKWRADIPTYASVEYEEVYKGVDLIYYGNQRQLEYDFKVAPGADPKTIRLRFEGADKIELDTQGDLVMHTAGGAVRQRRPLIYQETDGVRQEVAGSYVLKSRNHVGFEVGEYDLQKPLIIDPVLLYSTYLGDSGDDEGNSITVDAAGNAYVIGFTDSTNFPVANARQPVYGGNPQDVFVAKLNPSGTALIYSTYLGGSGQDNGAGIAVDAAGNAYITGYTGSDNFPTANALQPTRKGFFNSFVAKLNSTGSQLTYSTYFGGSIGEFGSAIVVDSLGNAYVGGVTSSPDFPIVNPIQSTFGGNLGDAFVAKINAAGSQLVHATYLGGNGNDGVTDIAIDSTGNAYVTGVTFSTNFPTANPFQANFRGGAFDAFVAKLNPLGTSLVFSTYLGGSEDDRGYRVGLDSAGNLYVAGQTSSPNFPIASALQPTFGGGSDAFITKLNSAGAISYSTFLGGSGVDGATGLAVDAAGSAFLTGFSGSSNFPLANPSQPLNKGGVDAFVTKLNPAGSTLGYSTYLGGSGDDTGFDIDVDSNGNAYVLGRTASSNFPIVNPLQPTSGGSVDVFIAKISSAPTPCAFFLPTSSAALSASAGTGSINFVATGSTCVWTAVSNAGFITITSATSGSGTGSLTYSVALNTGGIPRTGTLTIGGQTFTVNQAAPAWEPVVLTAGRVELKTWTIGVNTYAYVKLLLPNAGYREVNWGQVVRNGNDLTADATVEKFTGASVQAVTTTAQIYDLGPLANGTYNFNFRTSGTLAKTLQFTITSTVPPANPIDNAREFVKQQYRDFLNREADQAGEDFWTDNITKCNDPARRPARQTEAQCTLRQRETTSGGFFLSPEFQYTGYFVYRMYQGALGRQPKLSEFTPDALFVGNGIIVNGQLSAAKINQNKADFATRFVNCTDAAKYRCAEFKAIHDPLTNHQYVDKLFLTTGVNASASDRTTLVNGLDGGTETRATVLRKVVDGVVVLGEGNQQFTTTYGQAFYNSELNRAFVQLEYFGYMKRDPDDAGYAFWLAKLNQFGGNFVNAEMVLAFISSPEYRARFGHP